jgi:nitrogen regulatory protein P-II 1
MKLVTAIIQPDKLDEVREALIAAKITRISVSRVAGRGRHQEEDLYRGQEVDLALIPKVRIDIGCNDEFVEQIIETIIKAAKNGEGAIGDGKIFVTPLEQCIRIRTGERGGQAI